MLTITPPLAVDGEQVWILVASQAGAVDACRLAHIPGTDTFAALPTGAFHTEGALPAFLADGELVPRFRWATAADIDDHAGLFTTS